MSLFKKRPKEEPAAKEPPKEYSFTLSNGFRGYKKFPIVIHGNQEAEQNNERLKDADLRGKPILFREETAPSGQKYLSVYISGLRAGAVFDNSQIQQITQGQIEAVFAKMEAETVIDKGGPLTRQRVRLFAKYS